MTTRIWMPPLDYTHTGPAHNSPEPCEEPICRWLAAHGIDSREVGVQPISVDETARTIVYFKAREARLGPDETYADPAWHTPEHSRLVRVRKQLESVPLEFPA